MVEEKLGTFDIYLVRVIDDDDLDTEDDYEPLHRLQLKLNGIDIEMYPDNWDSTLSMEAVEEILEKFKPENIIKTKMEDFEGMSKEFKETSIKLKKEIKQLQQILQQGEK